jgi:DNA-binding NarL/FixJ family response regulator
VTTTRYSSGIYAEDKPESSGQGTTATVTIDLTEREMKVIQMVADGLTNKQVAQMLNVSHTRLEYILQILYTKLNVSGRIGLVRLAIRKGWVKA